MRRVSGRNIRQLIIDLTNGIERALELIVKDEIYPTDVNFLSDFSKCIEDHISQKGINLCNRVKLTLGYYYEEDINMTTDSTKGNPKFLHGIDKFLFEFN